ncbi:MAG: hypothetical protein F4020_02045 [Gammaproteobacteria bacterium]|nr:hypothetical protein [Gammaproteobacteria bacterium]MYK68372.1 hypothetical protein [Gammaproteobacteria bacterium]
MSEQRAITIKRSVDFNIVGENILDIADFAVEKYEFRNDTDLAPEVRKAATEAIRAALWARVEELKLKRKQILAGMFELADETAKRVVEGG